MAKALQCRINELSRTARGRWILAGITVYLLLCLMFFYSFIYNDIIETMRMGIDVWYSLFDGQLNYFYARRTPVDAIAYPKTVQGVYDFPIYIVFALWNFPLWIAENFFDVDVFSLSFVPDVGENASSACKRVDCGSVISALPDSGSQ